MLHVPQSSTSTDAPSDLLILTYSCPVKWDEMAGSHAIRHCAACSLNVHDVSAIRESAVDDMFSRIKAGEKVCIRSATQGPRRQSTLQSLRLGMIAVASLAIAWIAGALKSPVFANTVKRSSQSQEIPKIDARVPAANIFKIDSIFPNGQFPIATPISSNGQLAQLSGTDRYGFGVIASREHSAWEYINNIEASSPSNAPKIITKRQALIVARATNDRVIVADEVLELTNLYRKHRFDQAADNCLGFLVTTLDLARQQHAASGSRLVNSRIGETSAGAYLNPFEYSKTIVEDREHFNSTLATFEEQFSDKDYGHAANSLTAAMTYFMRNPLLKRDIEKSEFQTKAESLKPFLAPPTSIQLHDVECSVVQRLNDLSALATRRASRTPRPTPTHDTDGKLPDNE